MESALPRLFWVIAHSSGIGSRVCFPAPKVKKRVAQIVLRRGPLARLALAGPFLQRLTESGGRLFELRRSTLALSEAHKCNAQTVLGVGPVERRALVGLFFQRLAIGGDGLFQLRRPALVLPKAE